MADAVPGYEASAVTGIGAPANTPAEIVEWLNQAINAAFADPRMKARLAPGDADFALTFRRQAIDAVLNARRPAIARG